MMTKKVLFSVSVCLPLLLCCVLFTGCGQSTAALSEKDGTHAADGSCCPFSTMKKAKPATSESCCPGEGAEKTGCKGCPAGECKCCESCQTGGECKCEDCKCCAECPKKDTCKCPAGECKCCESCQTGGECKCEDCKCCANCPKK